MADQDPTENPESSSRKDNQRNDVIGECDASSKRIESLIREIYELNCIEPTPEVEKNLQKLKSVGESNVHDNSVLLERTLELKSLLDNQSVDTSKYSLDSVTDCLMKLEIQNNPCFEEFLKLAEYEEMAIKQFNEDDDDAPDQMDNKEPIEQSNDDDDPDPLDNTMAQKREKDDEKP